ncbi:protein phosphatase 2C 51-like [Humulus lupulus]|uniref:protein phosphatase 2C 51-like n=1 Tax=Humulus lupulus TaxID=3486 RepID=UPI002B40C863|nr:protein phosphatase 2C 51-like [Humulus lupulus]
MRGLLQKVTSCDGGSSSRNPFEFTDAAVDKEQELPDGIKNDEWVLEKINIDMGNHNEEEYHKDTRTLPHVSNGWISVIGRRRVMEDAVAVVEIDSSYHFFGVYDGHGGSDVANACRDQLHHRVEARIRGYDGGTVDWSKVMSYCFLKMDEEVGNIYDGGSGGVEIIHDVGRAMSLNTMGSTAMVVLVGKEAIVVANCGDSRTVLCRDRVAVPLSRDHKPDVPHERERVEAVGGRIINWNGYRVLGVLDTSRSIGDHYLRPFVISEPEVSVYERNELDAFLVIASDGLWDFMSNDFACEVVRSCFDGPIKTMFSDDGLAGTTASEAAALLAELAMARGSKDNISVIVVDLKKQIC